MSVRDEFLRAALALAPEEKGARPRAGKHMPMLEDPVAALTREGEFHSEGDITVDFVAAARRLEQQYEHSPALPVLLLVQAAVAAGHTEIEIRLRRQGYQLTAAGAGAHEGEGDILQPDSEWAELLRQALEVTLAQNHSAVAVEADANGKFRRWDLGSGGVARHQEPQGERRTGLAFRAEQRQQPWWTSFLPARRRADIHRELGGRLAFCPVPVKLDGRLINAGLPEKNAQIYCKPAVVAWGEWNIGTYRWLADLCSFAADGPSFALASPWTRPAVRVVRETVPLVGDFPTPVVGHRMLEGIQGLEARVSTNVGVLSDWLPQNCLPLTSVWVPMKNGSRCERADYVEAPHFLLPQICLGSGGADVWPHMRVATRVRRWIGIPIVPDGSGALVFVKLGVALDPVECDGLPPGTQGLIADDTVTTDITKLRVVENDSVETAREWAREAAEALMLQARGVVSEAEKFSIPIQSRELWREYLHNQ